MKKITLVSILFLFLFSSCGLIASFKIRDAFLVESMTSQSFKQELPFQEVSGMIVIEAEFQGVVKNFIFDTGATTILDKDFAATLEIQKIGKVKTVDSNNKKKRIPYVKLKEFKIGDISFYDMVASVYDMTQLKTRACIDISGIIGANAMNKCIWQIDYQNKKIIFTNQRDRLNLPSKEQKINFSATGKGVPTIAFYSDGAYWGEAIFDTGSNGGIAINKKYLPDSSSYVEKEVVSFGVLSSQVQKRKLAITPSIQLNQELTLNSQLMTFEEDLRFGIIGNQFLKDYKVTIDWMYQEIFLEQYEPVITAPLKDFGLYPLFTNNTIVVGSIRSNSLAYKKGLRLNDRIIQINDITFENDTYNKYCQYMTERRNWNSISLVVLKDDKKLKFQFEKSEIMELLDKKE